MNLRYPVSNQAQLNVLGGRTDVLEDGGLVGSPRWEDLRIASDQIRIPSAGVLPPTFKKWRDSSSVDGEGAYGLAFADNEKQMGFFNAQMPHNWLEGSDVYPHIHPVILTALGGNSVWRFEYTIATIHSAFPLTVVDTKTFNMAGAAFDHLVFSFDPIVYPAGKISTMLSCSIARVGDALADNYAGDLVLLEFDFHYQVDSSGSMSETSK